MRCAEFDGKHIKVRTLLEESQGLGEVIVGGLWIPLLWWPCRHMYRRLQEGQWDCGYSSPYQFLSSEEYTWNTSLTFYSPSGLMSVSCVSMCVHCKTIRLLTDTIKQGVSDIELITQDYNVGNYWLMWLIQICTNRNVLPGFREWTHEQMSQNKVGNNFTTIIKGGAGLQLADSAAVACCFMMDAWIACKVNTSIYPWVEHLT